MRRILTALILLTLPASAFVYLAQNQRSAEKEIESKHGIKYAGEEEEEDGPEELLKAEFLMTRDPYLNIVPTNRLIGAKKRMEELNTKNALERAGNNFRTTGLSWSERGPNNMGGRTRAILVDKNDPTGNTIFAGSVGGGLWKCINFKTANPTWTVVNDLFSNIAITCIKQSPINPAVMYFGTGEGWGNSDAMQGLGIWKSVNGGASWTQLASTNSLTYVQDLEFDNNGYIYASTRTTNASQRGILRSNNGGNSWIQVLTDPTAANTRGADLERGANGDIFATLGIFSTGHIFRSPANGVNTGTAGSWLEITPNDFTPNGQQRTELAVSATGSRLYVLTHKASNNGIGSMYKSDDFGASWTTLGTATWCDNNGLTNTDFGRGQAWYDLAMAVDPSNDNTVLAGGIVVVKSTNAGTSWNQMTRWTPGATCNTTPVIHADVHVIEFINSSEIIVATDGGIYFSADGGATFTNKNKGYNVSQYYSVAIAPGLGNNTIIAGAQDNGSHLFSNFGMNTASFVSGGDGGFCFIDQTNPSVWVTSYSYANFSIFKTNGNYTAAVNNNNGRFINPADYDDIGNVLYYGDVDGTYSRSSNIESGTIVNTNINISSAMGSSRQVSAIKIDPNNPTTIWLGCSNSENNTGASVSTSLVKVIKADGPISGSPSLQPVATGYAGPPLPPGCFISSIDVETGNSNHMMLTASNYGIPSVWESTDGGTTWNSLDDNGVNLPDMPVRWGMFIPAGYDIGPGTTTNGIMLATEIGIWSTLSTNGLSTAWSSNNAGFPNARVDMIRLRKTDKTIVAATHGRGVFSAVVSTVLPLTMADFKGTKLNNSIQLDWSTLTEANLKQFEVFKSTNGSDFYSIGKVKANGNSNALKNYIFTDNQVSKFNYYRLKIEEETGNSSVSKIVLVKDAGIQQNMWVVNNPFIDNINVRFATKATVVKLQLRNVTGTLLASKTVVDPAEQLRWEVPGMIPGSYILTVIADDKIFSKKLVRN